MSKQVLVSFCSVACLFFQTAERRLLRLLGLRVGEVKGRKAVTNTCLVGEVFERAWELQIC